MSIKSHIPISNSDDTWYHLYVGKIGETSLFRMRDYIYGLCDRLKVGEYLNITTWINQTHKKCQHLKDWSLDDTTDLFVKIIWCYMTESNGCYCFSNDYKHFRNYIHNARKMDKQPDLPKGQHRESNSGANGRGTRMQGIGTQAISTS